MIECRLHLLALALATTLVAGCGEFKQQADAKFGDQNFKTSIALIELYHVRHGVYPTSLQDLDFVGDWDRIALSAVQYERLSDGYALDVVRGWVGQTDHQLSKRVLEGPRRSTH
jgi:hypothetical protein